MSATVKVSLIILLMLAGCQSADSTGVDAPERNEGRAISATLSDAAIGAQVLPTRVLSQLATIELPSAGSTQPPTTIPPTSGDLSVTPSSVTPTGLPPLPPPSALPDLAATAPAAPESTSAPVTLFAEFVFGQSAEGRNLRGYRIGGGSRMLLLVGAVHGGFEENSTQLIEQLAAHFRENPHEVLPDVTLLLVPALNPDGLARGRVLDGRFNANGVDLNRNWGCGWSPVAYFRNQTVSAGASAFSEPETQALAGLIQTVKPAAVLFYHAAAAGVFSGDCGGDFGSAGLSETYARAAEYDFGSAFSAYPVTGTAPAWVNSLGIPSADVELASATDPEFARNLRAVMAVQHWLAP